MDTSAYLGIFIDQSRDLLEHAQTLLRSASPDGKELYRLLHTLKGMAAAMSITRLADLAHAMENGIELGTFDAIACQLEDFSQLLDKLASGQPLEETLAMEVFLAPLMKGMKAKLVLDLLSREGELLYSCPDLPAIEEERFDRAIRVQLVTIVPWATLRAKLLALPGVREVRPTERIPLPSLPVAPPSRRLRSPVRVSCEQLDSFATLLDEVAESQDRLVPWLLPEGRPLLERLQGRLKDARNALVSLRRVPLTALFNRYPRMVREMSQALGKEVILRTEGGELALDRRVVDELSSLLMHLLRNAIDHALESPEERIKAGKPRQGTVWLSAYPLGAKVRLEVRDDGRGIEPQRMRERVAELGCLSEEEARRLSDAEAIDWIFEAGFSTRDAVSCFSGRGVGMDVVRSRLEELGGTVAVETVPGEGTAFMLDLEPQ